MKITLIKPNMAGNSLKKYRPFDSMQPLTLAVLAGLTPPRHEVVFYDDRIEDIPFDEPTDLVGISVETYTAKRSYEIAQEFRKRNTPVVMGGFHPTLVPEEAIEYADSVVIGEAEGLWEQVLEDAQRKQLKRFYRSSQRPPLSGIKPRRDIFKGKKYLPLSLVEFGRGCRHSCEFCAVSAFYRQSYNSRPIGEVIKEIESIKGKIIFFVDDNIACDMRQAKELFTALRPLKKEWIGQSSIRIAQDDNTLRLMARSGCKGLLIGIESLNKENLLKMNKEWNCHKEDYRAPLSKIRSFGIKVYATFILGYDFDSKKSLEESLEFAIREKFFLTAFNHLVPFPGTSLHENLSKQRRLIYDKWWLDPSYRYGKIAFKPYLISADELSQACFRARRSFYSYESIFRRMLDFRANCNNFDLVNFFTLNLLLKKEVDKKMDFKLGKKS